MYSLASDAPGIPFVLNSHLEYQGASWVHGYSLDADLDSFNYEGLRWQSADIAKPSEQELWSLWENTYRAQWQQNGFGSPWVALRKKRNRLLAETDWIVSRAIEKSNDGFGFQLEQDWADYRQALRDLPANTDDPENPVWPVKPGG